MSLLCADRAEERPITHVRENNFSVFTLCNIVYISNTSYQIIGVMRQPIWCRKLYQMKNKFAQKNYVFEGVRLIDNIRQQNLFHMYVLRRYLCIVFLLLPKWKHNFSVIHSVWVTCVFTSILEHKGARRMLRLWPVSFCTPLLSCSCLGPVYTFSVFSIILQIVGFEVLTAI
jgi:hypothetical protein